MMQLWGTRKPRIFRCSRGWPSVGTGRIISAYRNQRFRQRRDERKWGGHLEIMTITFALGDRDIYALRQKQNLPVSHRGSLDLAEWASVAWPILHKSASAINEALCGAFDLPRDVLKVSEFHMEFEGEVSVGLIVSLLPGDVGDELASTVTKIRAAADFYSTLIFAGIDQHHQTSLLAVRMEELDETTRERLQASAHKFLLESGGTKISTPLVADFGDSPLIVSGAFAKKPPRPRLPPSKLEVSGSVAGLRSTRKELYILPDTGSELSLQCDPNTFAHRLRNAIHTRRYFNFTLLVDEDANGVVQHILHDFTEIEIPKGRHGNEELPF